MKALWLPHAKVLSSPGGKVLLLLHDGSYKVVLQVRQGMEAQQAQQVCCHQLLHSFTGLTELVRQLPEAVQLLHTFPLYCSLPPCNEVLILEMDIQ